jgi:hypothetical protein
MTLWLQVSKDKYSYPEIIAESIGELSWLSGATPNTIRSSISHFKAGRTKTERFARVEIEED